MQVNEERLHELVGQVLADVAGSFAAPLVIMGKELGFYGVLQESDSVTSQELADRTRTSERYVREWLSHQAAAGYLDYDPAAGRFSLSPEQAMLFAIDDSPFNMLGGFSSALANIESVPKVQDAFHTGEGVSWGDHSNCLFCAVEKFFGPSYKNFLVQNWLPALDGMVEKLERGVRVADVGCGHGISTVVMAEAFPKSEFVGYDFHEHSILHASDVAAKQGVADNCHFEVALAKNFPGNDYDLICTFDCLHDMGDPVGAAAHIRNALKPDGVFMAVEPMAADTLEENFTPLGKIAYAASTLVCVPTSLAQEVGLALGAQAGEARLSQVIGEGGFSSVRRAAETPFSLVLEARV